MINLNLTEEQKSDICYIIGDWYLEWKTKICASDKQHYLGIAKEDLKIRICGE